MHEGGEDDGELDRDLGESMYVVGFPYLKGWAEARAVADLLSSELARLGCSEETFRVAVGTGADGAGVVRLHVHPSVICDLVRALRLLKQAHPGSLSQGEVRQGAAARRAG
ncbi:hypothetical protein OG900_28865 [Streptomyces sp. NBC_00433]